MRGHSGGMCCDMVRCGGVQCKGMRMHGDFIWKHGEAKSVGWCDMVGGSLGPRQGFSAGIVCRL